MGILADNHVNSGAVEVILIQTGQGGKVPYTQEAVLSNSEQLKTIITKANSNDMVTIMSIHTQQDHILGNHIGDIIVIMLEDQLIDIAPLGATQDMRPAHT